MTKWTLSLIFGLVTLTAAAALAAKPTPTPAGALNTNENEEEAEAVPTWPEQKVLLQNLEAKFRDKTLSAKEKVKLVTQGNALLSEIADIEFTPPQKKEQVAVVVNFISATIESDANNSHTNTMYEDYKLNKKAYESEISKLSSKDTQKKIRKAFQDWVEFENDSAKTDAEPE
jgi:hypothetical protein